jgi:hypothetical protein
MQQGDRPIKGGTHRWSAAIGKMDRSEALGRSMVVMFFLSDCRRSQHQKNRQSRNAPRHIQLPPCEFELPKVLPRASPVKATEILRFFGTVNEKTKSGLTGIHPTPDNA